VDHTSSKEDNTSLSSTLRDLAGRMPLRPVEYHHFQANGDWLLFDVNALTVLPSSPLDKTIFEQAADGVDVQQLVEKVVATGARSTGPSDAAPSLAGTMMPAISSSDVTASSRARTARSARPRSRALAKRYPEAQVIALDFSHRMLRQERLEDSWPPIRLRAS